MSLANAVPQTLVSNNSILELIERDGLFQTIDNTDDETALALTDRYCAHNYHPLPLVVRRAEGIRVWDDDGKDYVDMIGSYSALSHGHRNTAILAAMEEQLSRVTLTSRAMNCPELPVFLAALCEYTGGEMAIPMNTGAEAVETAIKVARKWAYTCKEIAIDQAEIIIAEGNFHGRTTTIVGFSSEPQYKKLFGPFGSGFKSVPFGDIEALEATITSNTAAVLLEPIQAEAGIIMPPPGYMTEVRRVCTKHNVLLIWDEIQTGFCRTGRPFAWQWEPGAQPDMMTLGKALGGGVYPVSAVVGTKDVLGVLRPGDHGSTFGGNPLACVVGLASIIELRHRKLDHSAEIMGAKLMSAILDLEDKRIVDVRGRGLLIGVELDTAFGPAANLLPSFLEAGLITKDTHAQTLRFAPPLTMTAAELDEAIQRIRVAFSTFS